LEPATTAQLVSRARCGDREAFAALIRRYERTALAVAFAAAGGDASLAGDAVQEAFLRAWQRIAALKDDEKFATWLCGIARNAALDLRRKSRAADPPSPPAPADDRVADPVAELDRRETCERVDDALARLDDVSRTIVVLRYYEGLSSHAIAELLATTPAAVDMRLSRARQRLRCALEQIGT